MTDNNKITVSNLYNNQQLKNNEIPPNNNIRT